MTANYKDAIDIHLLEPELDEDEMALRREFARLYASSRNAFNVCLELGFQSAYAADWAKALLQDGVVRRLLREYELAEDTEESSAIRKRNYRAMMEKEATYYGVGASHGSRVAAIANLMKAEGMFDTIESPDSGTENSGVMVVPMLVSADEWGKSAAESQLLLKQKARE